MASLYKETYSIDPTDIIAQEWLSDEYSGPEEDSDETQEEWQVRMVEASGFSQASQNLQECVKFVEVPQPVRR